MNSLLNSVSALLNKVDTPAGSEDGVDVVAACSGCCCAPVIQEKSVPVNVEAEILLKVGVAISVAISLSFAAWLYHRYRTPKKGIPARHDAPLVVNYIFDGRLARPHLIGEPREDKEEPQQGIPVLVVAWRGLNQLRRRATQSFIY